MTDVVRSSLSPPCTGPVLSPCSGMLKPTKCLTVAETFVLCSPFT